MILECKTCDSRKLNCEAIWNFRKMKSLGKVLAKKWFLGIKIFAKYQIGKILKAWNLSF